MLARRNPLSSPRHLKARWLVVLMLGSSSAFGCAEPAARPPDVRALQGKPGLAAAATPRPASSDAAAPAPPGLARRVIVFVWDGLRPDSISAALTPELARLRDQRGVNFADHHAVYPTQTMMNAAAFATGARPGRHGYYGNYEYQPGPLGLDAKGVMVDYRQPFFSEDHAILQTLDAFYRQRGSALLRVETLFEAAHAAGLRTAAIGKQGPAFLQDYRQDGKTGVILDENVVVPRAFGLALLAAGLPLPKNTVKQAYPDGALTLAENNGDPTAAVPPGHVALADGVTPDPRAASGSPHKQRNAYLMRVFLEYVLPKLDPALAVIWLRNPDSTEHTYGPGTPSVEDALRHQDQLLGELLATLERLGRSASTDVLIVSDHGHSTVASDPRVFPPRALDGEPDGKARVGAIANPGYVVSGNLRSSAWLRRAGFPHVYDGTGCVFDPVLNGLNARGKPRYPTREDPGCGKQPRYTTPSYKLDKGELPDDAIVVAPNGGSEYYYLLQRNPALMRRLVSALQERAPYGPLFVRSAYGKVPGTLPLERIGLESADSTSPPMPDLIASFDWDADAVSQAAPNTPGTEHSTSQNARGMHGAFSPRDIHNVLIAVGPDFRGGFRSDYPSGNLDVAPTVASLLKLSLPRAEGRVLEEALVGRSVQYQVEPFVVDTGPVPLRRVCEADDLECKRPKRGREFAFSLRGRALIAGSRRYEYFEQAKATRSTVHSNSKSSLPRD
jgi:arylsulfatase A-like enzyme